MNKVVGPQEHTRISLIPSTPPCFPVDKDYTRMLTYYAITLLIHNVCYEKNYLGEVLSNNTIPRILSPLVTNLLLSSDVTYHHSYNQ